MALGRQKDFLWAMCSLHMRLRGGVGMVKAGGSVLTFKYSKFMDWNTFSTRLDHEMTTVST